MISSKFRKRFDGPLPTRAATSSAFPFQKSSAGFVYPVVANSRLWLDRNSYVYSDAAGTTPAVIGGSLAAWRSVGAGWGTDLVTQALAGLQPTLQSDGVQGNGTTTVMNMPGNIVLNDFTLYWVSSRAANNQEVVALSRQTAADPGVVEYTDGNCYVLNDAGSAGSCLDSSTGYQIKRMRRLSTNIFFKTGGGAETSAGLAAGNVTVNAIIARNGDGTNTAARICQIVLVTSNITPDSAEDVAILAALRLREPGVLGP